MHAHPRAPRHILQPGRPLRERLPHPGPLLMPQAPRPAPQRPDGAQTPTGNGTPPVWSQSSDGWEFLIDLNHISPSFKTKQTNQKTNKQNLYKSHCLGPSLVFKRPL